MFINEYIFVFGITFFLYCFIFILLRGEANSVKLKLRVFECKLFAPYYFLHLSHIPYFHFFIFAIFVWIISFATVGISFFFVSILWFVFSFLKQFTFISLASLLFDFILFGTFFFHCSYIRKPKNKERMKLRWFS